MLRQDSPFAGTAPPRALPIRFVLAKRASRLRRRVRTFRKKYDGIGLALVGTVTAAGAGFYIGQL